MAVRMLAVVLFTICLKHLLEQVGTNVGVCGYKSEMLKCSTNTGNVLVDYLGNECRPGVLACVYGESLQKRLVVRLGVCRVLSGYAAEFRELPPVRGISAERTVDNAVLCDVEHAVRIVSRNA